MLKNIIKSLLAVGVMASSSLFANDVIQSKKKTSFQEVNRHLDENGNFYLFLNTQDWGKAVLETTKSLYQKLKPFIKEEANEEDMAKTDFAYKLIVKLIKDSGISEIDGFGASSITIAKNLKHSKFVLHHEKNNALAWKLCHNRHNALDLLKELPENTMFASCRNIDFNLIYQWLETNLIHADNPEIAMALQMQLKQLKQQGIDIKNILASTDGQIALVITVSPDQTWKIPVDHNKTIEIPAISIMLKLRLKNDTIFQQLDAIVSGNPAVKKTDTATLKLRTMPFPAPLPFTITPSIAYANNCLYLATDPQIITDSLAVKAGKKAGIAQFEEFQDVNSFMPRKGVAFAYASPKFAKYIADLAKNIISADINKQLDKNMIEQINELFSKIKVASYSVVENREKNIIIHANSSSNVNELLTTSKQLTNIITKMLTDSLGVAKDNARLMSDINHLKQLNLGIIMYAGEHADKYPNDLGDIWDYIGNNGRVFVSPLGKTEPPKNADELRNGKCDYFYFGKRLKTTTAINHPSETIILVTNPELSKDKNKINIGYADGHVESKPLTKEILQKIANLKKK